MASVPELPGCHTQAKGLNELNRRIGEAIQLYLEDGLKTSDEMEGDFGGCIIQKFEYLVTLSSEYG